jgi:uncharacterized phage protein gp47/JayE
MPDSFDANGLQVKNLTELTSDLDTALQGIFGADINLEANSPDGQMVAIFAQAGVDLREMLANVNSGFDIDQAEGVTLDQRVGIIGLQRGAGTFSTVDIAVTVSKALSLVGLDSQSGDTNPSIPNLYTIKDDAGTQWYLLASQSPGAAGTFTYSFRAAAIGAVLVTPNTITTPVTIVGGVLSVNNPSSATEVGTDEETDQDLRARFHASTTLTAIGYLDSLEALLRNLPSVASAFVYENDNPTADAFGTPANTIWCIVDGGSPPDIAASIFSKKSMGAGMRGAQTYAITRENGQVFTAKWDNPNNVPLYIKFAVNKPGAGVDRTGMKTLIANGLFWDVGADAVGDQVTAFVLGLDSKYRVTSMGLSTDGVTYTEIVLSSSPVNRFTNSAVNMTISS